MRVSCLPCVALSFASLVWTACFDKKEAPSVQTEPATPGQPETSPPGEVTASATVPPLDLKPPSPDRDRAQRLNADGLKLHKSGDHGAAAAKFIEALQADPSHLLARYNLACAHALSDKRVEALAILRSFKDSGCDACLQRLARAKMDPDWKALAGDPEFKAITEAAPATGGAPATAEDAAQLVHQALMQPDRRDSAAALFASKPVTASFSTEGSAVSRTSIRDVEGLAKLAEGGVLVEMKLRRCSKECCSFEPVHDDDRSLGTQLREVCFAVDGAGVRTLKSLALSDAN
jgi:hypothetical protein